MATHLMDLQCGGCTYYISHGGETVYYSTSGMTCDRADEVSGFGFPAWLAHPSECSFAAST